MARRISDRGGYSGAEVEGDISPSVAACYGDAVEGEAPMLSSNGCREAMWELWQACMGY